MQSLSQSELDDAFHLAIFESEDAITKLVYRVVDNNPGMRDYLINEICEELHKIEFDHMGPVRYGHLMERLLRKVKENAGNHSRG